MFYLYIAYNSVIDRYYVGSSSNLESRLKDHNKKGHKAKYTRKQKGEWDLIYSEKFETRSEAMKREKQIKSWKNRKLILELIKKGLVAQW